MGRYPELDLSGVRTVPLETRPSLVSVDDFVRPEALMTDRDPLAALPDILAGRDLRRFSDAVAAAARGSDPIIVMMGGHVIKTGVTPCLIRLLEAGAVTAFAGNGSVAIHDLEIALVGRTSERVDAGIGSGDFGIAHETAELLNRATREASEREEGLGESLGRILTDLDPPYADRSLLVAAHRASRPFTLHVAIGTDVVHQHPSCDGRALGESTLRDFRILAAELARAERSIAINLGSAVIMPEVFLKALNVARNLGSGSREVIAANFDFIKHYRPLQNVLRRPTQERGTAYAFVGPHEVLIPLWSQAVLHRLLG